MKKSGEKGGGEGERKVEVESSSSSSPCSSFSCRESLSESGELVPLPKAPALPRRTRFTGGLAPLLLLVGGLVLVLAGRGSSSESITTGSLEAFLRFNVPDAAGEAASF